MPHGACNPEHTQEGELGYKQSCTVAQHRWCYWPAEEERGLQGQEVRCFGRTLSLSCSVNGHHLFSGRKTTADAEISTIAFAIAAKQKTRALACLIPQPQLQVSTCRRWRWHPPFLADSKASGVGSHSRAAPLKVLLRSKHNKAHHKFSDIVLCLHTGLSSYSYTNIVPRQARFPCKVAWAQRARWKISSCKVVPQAPQTNSRALGFAIKRKELQQRLWVKHCRGTRLSTSHRPHKPALSKIRQHCNQQLGSKLVAPRRGFVTHTHTYIYIYIWLWARLPPQILPFLAFFPQF